jgi:4-amino-4-deoxy-L-arabinose transferase-like glycosyltransferase
MRTPTVANESTDLHEPTLGTPENAEPPGTSRARHAAALGAFSLAFFAVALSNATARPMDHDELLTGHIARLPTVDDIWRALAFGADGLPPLSYLASRVAMRFLGDGEAAVRLPAVVAFWVACLCLYRFVARRCKAPYALVAALVPLASGAFFYATDARSYALCIAFCAFALVARQEMGERGRQAAPAVALGAALALAVASPYYAVLLAVPFGLAEVGRARTVRRVRWPAVAAIEAAGLSVLLYLPLVRATARYASDFWAKPDLGSIGESFSLVLTGLFLPLALGFVACAGLQRWRRGGARREAAPPSIPADDLVIAAAVAAFPLVTGGVALAIGVGSVDRYSLPSVVGVGLLVAFAAATRWRGRTSYGLAFVGAFALVILYRSGGPLLTYARTLATGRTVAAPSPGWQIDVPDDGLPVVVANPTSHLPLAHYSDPSLATRLVYVAAGTTPRHVLLEATADRGLLALEQSCDIAVEPYPAFVSQHDRFYVYEFHASWVVHELLEDHARVMVVHEGQATLYYVELPAAREAVSTETK